MAEKSRRDSLLENKDVRRWYDNVARGSEITSDVYLRRLGAFCERNSTNPVEFLKLSPKEMQDLLFDLVTQMQMEHKAGSYIASNVKAVKSWLSYNDVEIKSKIKIEGAGDTPSLKDERVPTKDELRKVFFAADAQQRVACVFLAHAGLRPETLGDYKGVDGLKVSDLPEVEIKPRKHEVVFKKIPTFVVVRRNLSKAGHQYVTLLTAEGCRYLKEYLEARMREGEILSRNSPILTPKKDSHTKKSRGSHIATTNVGDMIRTAIRKAGFIWRPYVLRAFFDSQLLIAENNGKMAKDYRAFFMGHKGDIEAIYTTSKSRLSDEMIEDMRKAFKKSSEYLVTERSETKGESELKRLFLIASGKFTKEEIDRKQLAELPYDELQKVLQERLSSIADNGKRQIVVPVDQVKNYLPQGYDFQANLGNGEAVLKLPI